MRYFRTKKTNIAIRVESGNATKSPRILPHDLRRDLC